MLKSGILGAKKIKFKFLVGKIKFEVLTTFVAFTSFWGCLDDEAT